MADGVIKIDFDMPLAELESKSEQVKNILKEIGSNAGDSMDDEFKSNADNVNRTAETTSDKVKSEFNTPVEQKITADDKDIAQTVELASQKVKNDFKEPVEQKLTADGDKATSTAESTSKQIKSDFKEPIEQKITGDDKGVATATKSAKRKLRDIPKETKTKLKADAEEHGIKNFDKLIKALPRKKQTELYTKAEKGEAINYAKVLADIPVNKLTKMELTDNASPKLKQMQTAAEKAETHFTSLKDIIAGSFVGGLFISGVQKVVGFLGDLTSEAAQSSDAIQKFQSTMKFGGFGEKEIGKATKAAKKYADDTVYDLETVTNTTAQLAANGIKNYTELTQSAGNLNSVAGGNADTFHSVAMMLTQTAGAGKLTTENWNQLADAIPGASGKLQEAMKKNGAYTGNFRDAMADGKISSDEFNKAITQLGMNDGAVKAAKSTNTFEGAMGQLEANVVSGMDKIINKIGKGKITDMINKLSDVTLDAFNGVVKFMDYVANHQEQVKSFAKVLAGLFIAGKVMSMVTALGRFKASLSELSSMKISNPLSKISGGTVLGKVAAPAVLAGGAGVAASLQEKSTGGKVGGSIGSAGGAVAGAALGNAILPGIGGILGASAGSWVGQKFGAGFGKSIEKSIKNRPIKASVKIKADIDSKKIAKSVQPTIKKLNKAILLKMGVDSKSITQTEKSTQKLFDKLGKQVDNYYTKKEKKSKKDLDALVKQGVLTQKQADEKYKKLIDSDNKEKKEKKKAYKQLQKDLSQHSKKIASIENDQTKSEKQKNKAIQKENKRFTKQYVADSFKAQSDVAKDASRGAKQQESIYDNLRKKRGKIDLTTLNATKKSADKQYTAAVRAARRTRDDVKEAADDKYHKTVAAAKRERDENGTLSADQYRKVVAKARKQRDDTKGAADDQYHKVTKSARNQHHKVSSEIENQKTEVVTKAQQQAGQHGSAANAEMVSVNGSYTGGMETTRSIWNGMIGGINGVLNGLHKGWGKLPKWKKHARGVNNISASEIALVGEEGYELAHDPQNGIYPVGLKGPEVRPLSAGTSILPHNMSKEFMQMTAGLPGYKKGKPGVISSTFSWVKDKLEDAVDFVKQGAGKAFNWVADKVGLNNVINGLQSGAVRSFGKGATETLKTNIVKHMKNFFKKFEDESGDPGGKHGNPGGSGVQRWRKLVKRALKANGLSTSKAMINKVLSQINTESGGNPKAMGGTDGLADGRAMGLMQTKPGTFKAYAFKGHGDIWNGYDNLLSGLHYAKVTYGPSLSFLGHGHGYAEGGHPLKPQLAWLAENNDEYVVNARKDSADGLISDALNDRAKLAPSSFSARMVNLIANAKKANGRTMAPVSGLISTGNNSVVGNSMPAINGNLDISLVLDGQVIGRASYPTIKALQSGQNIVVSAGGSVPQGGVLY